MRYNHIEKTQGIILFAWKSVIECHCSPIIKVQVFLHFEKWSFIFIYGMAFIGVMHRERWEPV